MTSSHQNFILGFAKQSLGVGLTFTKSLSIIGRMKKMQNNPSTSGYTEYQIRWSSARRSSGYNSVTEILQSLCTEETSV